MDLSVVIATTDASRSIDECLRLLEQACDGLTTELIVADASTDGTADRVSARAGSVTLLRYRPGTLTPQLWAEGYRHASGRFIAFTTGHCLVSKAWAGGLVEALKSGAAGAGGPLGLTESAGALDRAVYFLRYSAFMPSTLGSGRIPGEIAGDNAMYWKDWLDRNVAALTDGFWEVDFHRFVRASGGWLAAVPAASAGFGRSFPAWTILTHRFAHGTHFGAGRVRGRTRAAWQIVLASPLVPLVLTARATARVLRTRGNTWPFLTSLPWFLLLASAWASGEAWGAVRGARIEPADRLATDSDRRVPREAGRC